MWHLRYAQIDSNLYGRMYGNNFMFIQTHQNETKNIS